MKLWHDETKIAKYGYRPYLVDDDYTHCELYAQGRDIERKKKLRATHMFEQDLKQCGDDLNKIIELARGVDWYTWKAARELKREQAHG
jgi:hypothetical protein